MPSFSRGWAIYWSCPEDPAGGAGLIFEQGTRLVGGPGLAIRCRMRVFAVLRVVDFKSPSDRSPPFWRQFWEFALISNSALRPECQQPSRGPA